MRNYIFFLGLSLLLFLAACGSDEGATPKEVSSGGVESTESVSEVLEPNDFDKMYSNPLSYEGYELEFMGQVFVEPERDDEGTYLQVYAKPEEYDQNIIVAIDNPNLEVKTDDYVRVTGIVFDKFEGENLMGGTVIAPVIHADKIEVVDYITAIAPTIKTIEVNEGIDQHGFVVHLQRIELAKSQTRVYVKVTNNTNDSISYYTHSNKLVVGSQQLEPEYVYDSGLSEVQSDILPGIESEGVAIFPAIDENVKSLKFYADGYSDNYELSIEPFIFEVAVE